MTLTKNKLKYWRHTLQMERKQFSAFLEVNYTQYTQYENNKSQPELDKLISFWHKLKTKYPNINLQDLLEI